MSQADALLAAAAESTAELGEAVVGTMVVGYGALSQEPEGNIVIGTDRIIKVPERLRRIAVQFDHNIETVTFDCPRYWDGHDMSEMRVYINYRRSDKVIGSYRAANIFVDESDGSVMHFTWTVSKNVTMAKGQLDFLVCIKKADEDGNETNHWNSELNQEMYISEGLESGEPIVSQYPDVIGQLEMQNQAMIEEVTNQLLADRDAGLFNPTVEVTEIAGGHILTITSGSNITEFEILDGSTESIRNFLASYVTIGDTEPASGPAFWFDNTDQESSDNVVLKYKDGDNVVTALYPVVRINGVEGTKLVDHLNSMDNPHGTTAAQVGAVANKGYATTGTGAAYTATVDGITELTAGISFTMIPHVASTNVTPTLNVNGLGAKGIRRRLSNATGSIVAGGAANWLTIGVPVLVTYDGEYWIANITKTAAEDIDGEVPVTSGGTGKKTWTANNPIYPISETELGQVAAPTEDKSTLRKDVEGAPYWSTIEELIQDIGAVRIKLGSYTGQGNTGNLDLGVEPKLLLVRTSGATVDLMEASATNKFAIFIQGESYTKRMTGYDSNVEEIKYNTYATLTGSTLVFSSDGNESNLGEGSTAYYCLNIKGSTYRWVAFY